MSQTKQPYRKQLILMALLVAGLAGFSGREPSTALWTLAVWFLVSLAVESFRHPSLDGESPISMAPAVHLAALAALPLGWGIPLVTAAAAVAAVVRERGRWGWMGVQVLATGIGAMGASFVFFAGGVIDLHRLFPGTENLWFRSPKAIVVFLGAGAAYLVLNQGLLSLAASRRREVPLVEAWRKAYGHETELVTSFALVVVSFLAVICYLAVGYRGILLCIMPVLFIRDGSQRNIELRGAQGLLIKNERLAAKGEMAAEIGHELNNYLAAISGRAQLLLRKVDRTPQSELFGRAEAVHLNASRMAEMAKGLMRFSHREVKRSSVGVNDLIEKTVEFVRPQTRFRSLEFAFAPDVDVPPVEMDPGEIQQVLLTLFGQVAGAPGPGGVLRIRTYIEAKATVGIEIVAPHLGGDAPATEDRARLEGTLRRILERHHGRFEIVDDAASGDLYRVSLPAA